MKLWSTNDGNSSAALRIGEFTAGRDRDFDLLLAPFDILGSIAQVRMLASVGLVTSEESEALQRELRALHADALAGRFVIEADVEDVHSQVEVELTRRLGDAGKKVHTGRSRNDQVLVDLKLFLREEIRITVDAVRVLFDALLARSDEHRDALLPGYTHLQVAMPSSFGMWFGAWAECLAEDLSALRAAYELADRNPLGSGAGYGSSFPIDREETTRLLCFGGMHVNAVAAQMSRGRTERAVATGLAALASTLARMAMDATLFISQNFGFLSLPAELTTGSSIMPHKANPDAFELIRARCNRLQALPNDIALVTANLPSGYHRDMQVLKELLFPALKELRDCLSMAELLIRSVRVHPVNPSDERYRLMFTVEAVNALVQDGAPFRDAYRDVASAVKEGTFIPSSPREHTHTGSIGNPRNDLIRAAMDAAVRGFGFERLEGLRELLGV
jgi:argininosuccinate lyase